MPEAAPQPTSANRPAPGLAFRVLGFPVRVRIEFLLVTALLGSMGDDTRAAEVVGWIAVAFVSILFHELGHAIVAKRVGYRPWIELYGMGGLTHCEPTEKTPPAAWHTDLAIALAGPTFGLFLGAAVWLVDRSVPRLHADPFAREIVWDMLWVNVGWSVLNLVPILPYDGGLAAMAVLRRLFPVKGARIAYQLTAVLSVLALAWSIRVRWIWTGYLAARALFAALRVLRFDGAMSRAWRLWDTGRFTEARARGEQAVPRGLDPFGRARALELVVFACLAAKDAPGAKTAHDAIPGPLQSPLLRTIVLLDTGETKKAAELIRYVPPAMLVRVMLPILVSWGVSGWEDRAAAWLDGELVRALPEDVARSMREVLEAHGCRGLAEQMEREEKREAGG